MMKLRVFILLLLSLLFVGCRHKSVSLPQPRTDRYSSDSLKSLASHDFEAAFRLVCEGENCGDLTQIEADILRASLIYQYDDNYPQSIRYCRRALAALDDDEVGRRVETLYLLATVAYADKNLSECLQACSEGKDLAHRFRLPFQEYSFDYLVGECQFALHREDDGLRMMCESIENAKRVAKTRSDYGHLIYFENNLISAYSMFDDHDNVLSMIELLEISIDEMESLFPDEKQYYDRYRYYIYSGRAEAKALQGRRVEAEADFREALSCNYVHTRDGAMRQMDYYAAIGQVDSVLTIGERFPYQETDTVRRNYRMRLWRIEHAYRVAGDTVTADQYLHRIEALSRLIERREQEEGTAVSAAQYDTQYFQLALNDMAQTAQLTRLLLCLLALAVALTFLILHRVNKIKLAKAADNLRAATRSMQEEMERLQKQVRLIAREGAEAQPEATRQSAKSLAAFIEGQKLYLNKDISRSLIAQLMGCSQQTMTKMLNEIQPDLSFPDYIKSLRITHALNLIKENPNLTVQEVADASGFYSISSFERSFKAVTGKTPRAYMKEMEG